MIRKVYEVDPLLCPECGGRMRMMAFLTDYSVADRIINHLKLTFVASKSPPPRVAYQEVLMTAEADSEYFALIQPAHQKTKRLSLYHDRESP
jgi:hypothetical protein